jgi:hypothetical protein
LRTDEVYLKITHFCKVKLLQRCLFKETVDNFVEYTIGTGILRGIVANLAYKVLTIQRNLKNCLAYRRKVYEALLANWETLESSISLKNVKKKEKRGSINQNFLSNKSKLLFIQSYIKSKVKYYLESLKTFEKSSLSNSCKPLPLDMLSSTFLQQASIHIKTSLLQKRLSTRKSTLRLAK